VGVDQRAADRDRVVGDPGRPEAGRGGEDQRRADVQEAGGRGECAEGRGRGDEQDDALREQLGVWLARLETSFEGVEASLQQFQTFLEEWRSSNVDGKINPDVL
jgi:hypothetical protein